MGYYSDVQVVFYTRFPERVPPAAVRLWFDENYPKREAETEWDADIEYHDNGLIRVSYEDVKWRGAHPDAVKIALTRFIETFCGGDNPDAEHDESVAWEFVRVGEELDDIVNDGSHACDYILRVVRTIELG